MCLPKYATVYLPFQVTNELHNVHIASPRLSLLSAAHFSTVCSCI